MMVGSYAEGAIDEVESSGTDGGLVLLITVSFDKKNRLFSSRKQNTREQQPGSMA